MSIRPLFNAAKQPTSRVLEALKNEGGSCRRLMSDEVLTFEDEIPTVVPLPFAIKCAWSQ